MTSADSARASEFVRAYGTPSELSRLRVLLEGTPPSANEQTAMLAGQRPDGGWAPFWAADYSSVDATCFRLTQAEQGGIAPEHEAIQRAAHFLHARQHSDGSWEEDADAALTPPWATPGDLAARLYLTANSTYWLARLLPQDAAATAGAAFLRAHLDAHGALPTFLHAHWLAAGAWYRLGEQALTETILAVVLARLDEHTPSSSLSWLITCLRGVDISSAHPVIMRAVGLLESEQRADGGWASEDGSAADVHATLESLRALRLCGKF